MKRLTQQNAIQKGAELVAEEAKMVGARCRVTKGIEAITILEQALGVAYAEAAMWQGANDSPERLNETARLSTQRIAAAIRLQHFLRRGGKFV